MSSLNTVVKGELHIAAYANFYPICYRNKSDGSWQGFDVEIIKAFARELRMIVFFHEIERFDELWLLPTRNSLNYDISIGGISYSPERNNPLLEWSDQYFTVERSVVYNVEDPICEFPRDAHGIIHGAPGSTGYRDAVELLREEGKEGRTTLEGSNNNEEDIRLLLEGKIQGVMRGSLVGLKIVQDHPTQLGLSKTWTLCEQSEEAFAFPFRNGSGLCALMNEFLQNNRLKISIADISLQI